MSRFSFPCSPQASAGVLKNDKLRITVLTPCMLRLETGHYTDLPTQSVWNRDLGKVDYQTRKEDNFFLIRTSEVEFCIDLRTQKMHSITLSDGTVVNDFEKGNLLGTARTLDNVNGPVKLEKGVISRSGVAVMDDSRSLLLHQDGTIAPRETCSDLYFFAYGQDYRRCLQHFFALTGKVPLIPKFALGNWWSRYYAYTQEEYIGLMQTFIRKKLPVTVATIDMDWHWVDVMDRFGPEANPGKARTKEELFYNSILPGWTGYSWNTELFPDYKAMLRWLHDHNFHVTVNVHPSQGFRFFEDCYETVCRKMGINPATKERVPFDIANPKFVETYLDDGHHGYEDDGVDFWWLDWQQGKVTHIEGLDPLWALNHYHFLDNGRGEKRPLILSRYAGLGSHRYPLGFSGDTHITWASLDFQPYFTNNAANAGYTWWSHDIGGHMHGVQDDELYLRWLQYGVFSPINRLHSSNSDFMGKEPWKRSWAVEQISNEFLRLRHKLIPYLYTANYRTHIEGTPICMPMYYNYHCDEAYECKNQYIFGSQLLVAPITQPAEKQLNLGSVQVWLPEGRWTDIFNGRIYQGGQWVWMYRDLDSIPVLAPEGAIVPMYTRSDTNDLSLEQPLDIHVWRGDGNYELYEDDGETYAYQNGAHAVTPFTLRQIENRLVFTIHKPWGNSSILPESRKMNIRFRDVEMADVTVNGKEITVTSGDICVPVTISGETIVLELNNVVGTVNPPRKEMEIDILTRLQWSNNRKNRVLKQKNRYPQFLKNALSELDALI